MADKDLRTRTRGEEVWLWRRARGLTQEGAAARLGVGRGSLSRAERDVAPTLVRIRLRQGSEPALPLLLVLARRRSGVTLEGLAEALGVSRVTVLKREARGDPFLRAWWGVQGYRFN